MANLSIDWNTGFIRLSGDGDSSSAAPKPAKKHMQKSIHSREAGGPISSFINALNNAGDQINATPISSGARSSQRSAPAEESESVGPTFWGAFRRARQEVSQPQYDETPTSNNYAERPLNQSSHGYISSRRTAPVRVAQQDDNIEPKRNPFNNDSAKFDGVIGNFKQGNTNDCGLLAAVKSLSETATGAQILKNAIRHNSDGTITVRLHSRMPLLFGKYIDSTYSPHEIMNEKGISTGDPDVRAIEKAMKDYRVDKFRVLDLTRPEEAFYALTGKNGDYYRQNEQNNTPENMLNDIKNGKGKYAAVAGLPNQYSGHAFSVISFDGSKVTLVDPLDSSKTLTMSKNEFLDKLISFDSINMGN